MSHAEKGKLYLGTSGWMYKDWGGHSYPKDITEGHLAFLATEFNTVEVNTSFYHLPLKSTFEKWCKETPEHFVFAVKLSRFITHLKKLKSVRKPLEKFIRHAKPLGAKRGVILVQLPPSLAFNEMLFAGFLEDIQNVIKRNYNVRFVIEPRHESWVNEHNRPLVLRMLREAGIAAVFAQAQNIPAFSPVDENITASHIYVRFHGPTAFAASRYGPSRLRPWAERIAKWIAAGLDVFVYFNNDVHGHAIYDARTLLRQLGRRGIVPAGL